MIITTTYQNVGYQKLAIALVHNVLIWLLPAQPF